MRLEESRSLKGISMCGIMIHVPVPLAVALAVPVPVAAAAVPAAAAGARFFFFFFFFFFAFCILKKMPRAAVRTSGCIARGVCSGEHNAPRRASRCAPPSSPCSLPLHLRTCAVRLLRCAVFVFLSCIFA